MLGEMNKMEKNKTKIGAGLCALAVITTVVMLTQFSSWDQTIVTNISNGPESIPSPSELPLSVIGNKTISFTEAKLQTGITNTVLPSYMPQNLEFDSIRTIRDSTGGEMVIVYSQSGVKSTDQTTIERAIANGLVISIKEEKSNTSFNWNEYVKQQVAENPIQLSSVVIGAQQLLLVKSNPDIDSPNMAKIMIGNLRIEAASKQFNITDLEKIVSSMI